MPFNDEPEDDVVLGKSLEGLVEAYMTVTEAQAKVIKMAGEMLEVVGYPVLDGKHFWTKK
ncbi:hypothetical protein [Serratia marcescens]|uniref:hypothetical protein n=1 Tax=Serratia marcescens TaxID=615 RepID=UPI00124BE076|nr:hypothetical protein [Serratia marcescens]QFH59533.1 hypothetical protein FR888_09530 [Serratia marcescens]